MLGSAAMVRLHLSTCVTEEYRECVHDGSRETPDISVAIARSYFWSLTSRPPVSPST
jgi:hypothetical protein